MASQRQPNQTERDAPIATILAAFLLGDAAIAAFASAIYQGRVDTLTAAYDATADAIGVDTSDAEPSDDLLTTMATESQENAASVVATYNEDVTAEANGFVDAWESAHDTLDGCEAALQQDLTTWAIKRADWKAAQIAMYESGRGYSAGVDWFVSDILSGDLDLPEGTALSDLVVLVQPDDAAEPLCADLVAGNPYPLDAADDVLGDTFPVHPNCVHYTTIEFA